MELKDLNLDRNLSKSNQNVSTETSTEVSVNNENNGPDSKKGGKDDAKEVLTGTVITSCFIQSSNSGDRIEISSSYTFNGNSIENDAFVAFNNGIPIVIIDKNGIFADNITGGSILSALQLFVYQNIEQPVIYYGRVNDTGGAVILPLGWSSTQLGTGEYRVTHNLGMTQYIVNITAFDSVPVIWIVDGISSNSFTVKSFDDSGVAIDGGFMFSLFRTP